MIELTEILFPWGVADEKMFHLLKESLGSLDRGESIQKVSIIFETKAMTLGGYGINLDACCMCGRGYTGEGMAVYKREKGGIACLRCQQVSAISPKMEPDTVNLMKAIQSGSSNIMRELDLTDEIMTEINSVLKIHREYHLGMRPKTAGYLG
jgi:DNA repair protein RecO